MTRSERFSDAMHSLDLKTAGMRDSSKATFLSDHGEGVERMVNAIDHIDPSEALTNLYTQKLHTAEMRLYRAWLGHLVPTLRLIAKYRGNRQEAIWCIQKSHRIPRISAEVLYFSHRKKLLNFFLGQ